MANSENEMINLEDYILDKDLEKALKLSQYLKSKDMLELVNEIPKDDLEYLDEWGRKYKTRVQKQMEEFKNDISKVDLDSLSKQDTSKEKYSLTFLEDIQGFAVELYYGNKIDDVKPGILLEEYILLKVALKSNKIEYKHITDLAINKSIELTKAIFKDYKYKLLIQGYLIVLLESLLRKTYRMFKDDNLDILARQYAEADLENSPNKKDLHEKLINEIESSNGKFENNAYKYNELENIIQKTIADMFKNNALQDYDFLPNSTPIKFMKNLSIAKSNTKNKRIPVNKNVKVWETPDLQSGSVNYDYIVSDKESYNLKFDNIKSLQSRQSISLRKTLNFIFIKANEQNNPKNIYFDLKEYQEATGYKSKDTAYRGAKRNFEHLRSFSIGGTITRGNKEIRNRTSYIFIAKDISYNQCFIECKPELVEMLSQYFTLLPKWAGELNTKAYDLLDYIFYMARQKQNVCNIQKDKTFNISFKAINDYIGGHDPLKTDRHTQQIIDPIFKAIEEIENTQKGERLYITPIYNHDYKNVYEFLEGYIEIKLGQEATEYFCNRNKIRNKKMKKSLKK